MSVTFGCDLHPGYQASFDFKRARRAGYRFAFVKTSEGSHYVPNGFGEYFRRGVGAGLVMGGYHFLDGHGGTGRQQALHFLDTMRGVGGFLGRLIAVDFENYGNRSPSNEQLQDFVKTVKRETRDHAVIIYSTASFWNGGDSSGPFENYGADAAWEARVWYDEERRLFPKRFYPKWLKWYQGQSPRGLGGKPAKFHQFTWGGRVGGLYVDTNAFRGDMDDLLKLTTRSAQVPSPEPQVSGLERNIKAAKEYGLGLLKHHPKYWCWDGGSLDRNVAGRPGCHDGPPPPTSEIKKMFCADLITLMLRKLGKPVPKNGIYPGGTRSFQLKYGDKMKRFNLSDLREGDVAFVDFQNPHAPEGHIGFCLGDGPNARFLQSYADSCATLEPGLNAKWTIRESHDGFYYTDYIPREVIWG